MYVGRLGDHCRACDCEEHTGKGGRKTEGLRSRRLRRLPGGDGFQNSEHDEVGEHRSAAVAEERCHHAGKRQHAQGAAGDQQNLQRRGRGQAGGQKELVIGARAQRDLERSVDQECVKREDGRDAEEAPLLA